MTGSEIKQWRETHKLSQKQMAKLLHLGRSDTVSRWELGSREPSPFLYLALEALDARLAAENGNA